MAGAYGKLWQFHQCSKCTASLWMAVILQASVIFLMMRQDSECNTPICINRKTLSNPPPTHKATVKYRELYIEKTTNIKPQSSGVEYHMEEQSQETKAEQVDNRSTFNQTNHTLNTSYQNSEGDSSNRVIKQVAAYQTSSEGKNRTEDNSLQAERVGQGQVKASPGESHRNASSHLTQHIFYNRVPKCGSHATIDLITAMSNTNNFTFIRDPEYMTYDIDVENQINFIKNFQQIPTPMLYERHLHFLDFPKYGVSQPTYVNIIRDPLERLVSWYYFRRYQSGHERDMSDEERYRTFDECVLGRHAECTEPQGNNSEVGFFKIIPFFCGQEDICRKHEFASYAKAVNNVEKHFLLVGVTEQFAQFVKALELLIPSYFTGAQHFYRDKDNELWQKHHTTYKLPPSPRVKEIMKKYLTYEYKFYDFIKQRFYETLKRAESIHR